MSPKSTEPEMSPLITKRKSPKLRTSICSIDSQKFVPQDDSEVPYTPEEEIITRIAALCKQLWPAVMEGTIDVQYLDEGTFNQIYVISCADIAGQLPDVVLRLPWEDDSVPRTVAILEYLNEFTDLKVPKVINWDATEDNALEHDFVILSRIPGRNLQSVLGDLSQEQKLIIAEQLAQLYRQMESITSPIAGRMKAHKKFPSGGRADNNVFIQPFGTEWLEIADNPIDWNNRENGILPIERLRHDPPGLSVNDIMLPIYQRRIYEALNRRTPYEYLLDRFEPLQKMVQGMVDNELFKPENDHICLQHPDFFPATS
ncbi:phosphotransferase enzyme family protein [Apiospora arundinis]